ncbi:putative membrane protein [Panicum miliaceum]|uniref:Membrane protein n=1 Tax=Panicum miliaceum TaxID=4540 RepID=A0A3L6Q9P4_PANMI|nr:putative membrane protein [Panicum miliaceum]
MVVGPVAAALMILGNVGVILVLFPAHVWWTIYSLIKTDRINGGLKLAVLLALPVLFALWLGLGIFGSALVALGYGFFTPWISTFEAFRQETEAKKFVHGIVVRHRVRASSPSSCTTQADAVQVLRLLIMPASQLTWLRWFWMEQDGTWGTIKGSCTVVRDFADICFHSYPVYLKELRESSQDREPHSIRLLDVPSCIVVALLGLVVDIPLYTVIALIKSPYMLFKGWQRLLHDLISREGPFLETVCVPIAGLAILFWPLVVVGSVLLAIVSSIFVGLYGAVIVFQEKSFQRGVSYVVAMVAEFDEYTNDWLYLREGTILPKPSYRKRKSSNSTEFSVRTNASVKGAEYPSGSSEAPAMLVPNLAPSRSVREAIQEVKMVQIWENMMKSCEQRGRDLLNLNVITAVGLTEWLRAKESGHETISLGLPSYSLLCTVLQSIKAGAGGLLLGSVEVNQHNRPQDRLLDWFFHPVLVLKEQIQVLRMTEEEVRFLEKLTLFAGNAAASAGGWDNGAEVPQDPVRLAQIQAISRRLVGIVRSLSKFPTYRRRYRHVVKLLIAYSIERDGSCRSSASSQSVSFFEITQLDV